MSSFKSAKILYNMFWGMHCHCGAVLNIAWLLAAGCGQIALLKVSNEASSWRTRTRGPGAGCWDARIIFVELTSVPVVTPPLQSPVLPHCRYLSSTIYCLLLVDLTAVALSIHCYLSYFLSLHSTSTCLLSVIHSIINNRHYFSRYSEILVWDNI